MEKPPLPTALYCRLSREDGDRMESDSIGNQRKLPESYIENHPGVGNGGMLRRRWLYRHEFPAPPPFSGCCGT